MAHVRQFIAYMDRPLGCTSEHAVAAQHACYDALYQRYHIRSETFSAYLHRLMQSVRHYNALHVYQPMGFHPTVAFFEVWGEFRMGGNWVAHEPYVTKNPDL